MIQASLLLEASDASLNETALSLARRAERDAHWSRFAIILGRIDDEQLYVTYRYGSARAYAELSLRIPSEEYFTLKAMWSVMKSGRDEVGLDEWLAIPKTYALQVKRAMTAKVKDGVRRRPLREWFGITRRILTDSTGSADSLRREVDRYLENEEWVAFAIRLPALTYDLLLTAMLAKLPQVVDEPDPDPELLKDKKYRHRCLEAIVTDSLAGNALPEIVCDQCGAALEVTNDGVALRVRRHACGRERG